MGSARCMRASVVVGVAAAVGCGDPSSPAATVGDAAGSPRAALDEDRRQLADPQRYPLRDGMTIDPDGLQTAWQQLRARHGPQVAIAYQRGLDALPVQDPPTAPTFTEVVAFSPRNDAPVRDAEALQWLMDVDVHASARRWLSTYLTLAMVQDLGLSSREVGVWMGFLRTAEPTLHRCGGEAPDAPWLCVGYGDDVFVLEMARHSPGWTLARLRWMQRPAAD